MLLVTFKSLRVDRLCKGGGVVDAGSANETGTHASPEGIAMDKT